MADTYTQIAAVRAEPDESASSRAALWRRWPAWILSLIVLLWAASEIASLAIDHSRLRTKLTAHLESAFGRPVEVGRYSISLWKGPSLEAHSLTVGEDPRFGNEYFLRADSITVRLRWLSLVRGHIEFATLSLEHPSLNVVRNAAGDWNLAEWLPRPAQSSSTNVAVGPVLLSMPALRFRNIEVDDGRINFKRSDEKLPFAFTGVTGAVSAVGPGRWQLDLSAAPWRAAALVQQAGSIHLSGLVGGTSSRLRPAALDLFWTNASISDVLRLVGGNDYGIRGSLALSLSARTHDRDAGWTARGRAEFRQLHRWNLASRPDNPSLNFNVEADWSGDPRADIELNQLALEAPHSNAYATGRVSWNLASAPAKDQSSPLDLSIFLSQIDLRDLLSWVRAFHLGVADGVSVRGSLGVRGTVAGWPPRATDAFVSGDGADLSVAGLRVPAHLGHIQVHYDRGIVSFAPTTLSFAAPSGPMAASFVLSASAKPASRGFPDWRVAGSAVQMHDLVAAASAFGWNISRGWDLAGPFSCDLTWRGARYPWQTRPVGSIEFGAPGGDASGASLRAPFLNQPVEQIRARADLKPSAVHVALASAEAFGTRWAGTFDRSAPDGEWRFSLSAGRLEAAGLDRWLNPRWRESFLDRMLPFLNSRTPSVAVPESLRAAGRLNLDQFVLAPLSLHRVQGDLRVAGRHIEFANATGQFYSGTLDGSIDADLEAAPSYDASIDFSRVDLADLSDASPQLAGLFAGLASGEASFHAQGAARADLLASLECRGTATAAGLELRSIDLPASLRDAARRPGTSLFRQASAGFTCANRGIQFQDMLFLGPEGRIDGSGSVGFSRDLDLHMQMFPVNPSLTDSRTAQSSYGLTGPLEAPEVARIPPARHSR